MRLCGMLLPGNGDINGDGTVNYAMLWHDSASDAMYSGYLLKFSDKSLPDAFKNAGVRAECLFRREYYVAPEIIIAALTQHNKMIDVIFLNDEHAGLDIINAVEKSGLVVGKDIYIVCVGSQDFAGFHHTFSLILDGRITGSAVCDEDCLISTIADVAVLAARREPLDIYYAADFIKVTNKSMIKVTTYEYNHTELIIK